MHEHFLVEASIILPAGMLLLRLAGKKTLAEMTTIEIISTLCIGTLMGHAISEKGLLKTLVTMALIVFVLIAFQKIQMKQKWFEKLIIGNATILIEEGQVLRDRLKKVRMTENQLDMRLRQLGINTVSQVKTATIEANGQLGYELYPNARPLTYGEFMQVLKLIGVPLDQLQAAEENETSNLFEKVKSETKQPAP
jgi:uncharacterized membrane protein YcaP (DUF421 family)